MKRTILWLMAAALLFGALAGCKIKDIGVSTALNDVPLETILERLYEEAALELPERGTTTITAENAAYYFGTDGVEFSEAIASEALINVVPFSVCLLRAEDAGGAEKAAGQIKENANPNKWVCVSLAGDKVITDYAGNVAILIMAEEAEALHAAFKRLAKG